MTGPATSEISAGMGQVPPIVSVIVPAYNKPEYLPECLESIRAQTFPDWECIVVDDGSPRGEEIRAAVEGMQDERFRLIRCGQNRGPAAARNTGANNARGEWLLLVDEDDSLMHDAVVRLMREAERSGADLVAPARVVRCNEVCTEMPEVPRLEVALVHRVLPCIGFLVRRRFWDCIGGQDERLTGYEDFEWMIRAVAAGCKIATLREPLYVVRKPESMSEMQRSNAARARMNARELATLITEKHADLYRRFPGTRRAFLFKMISAQAREELRAGHRVKAFLTASHAFLRVGGARKTRWLAAFAADCLLGEDRRPFLTP